MSLFECPVVQIDRVENHPGADRLSLVYFNEFITISAKLDDGSHRYKVGDIVVYVPEAAIVPEYLLRQGFWNEEANKGILAGPDGNIVKAIKLRKILSQGIMFPTRQVWKGGRYETWINGPPNDGPTYNTLYDATVGDDVSGFLGITKYEQPIPASMSGDVVSLGREKIVHFDVENIKKRANVLNEGELVVITEKLHGTMMGIGYIPSLNEPDLWYDGSIFPFSKGLAKQGLVMKRNEHNLARNVYSKILEEDNLWLTIGQQMGQTPLYLFGEVYGAGIQDLNYGTTKPEFRLFDAYYGVPGKGEWCSWSQIEGYAKSFGLETVPVLYKGPYHPNNRSLKDGPSTLAKHIKEGIVIKPIQPREHPRYGRVILKDVSDAYLTRKNGTEYN